MSDPYEKAKGGRLTFKGGSLATRSKSIDKKKKNKKKQQQQQQQHKSSDEEAAEEFLEESAGGAEEGSAAAAAGGGGGGEVYTIDAAKRMKYEQLFPVEAKKFGYDPKSNSRSVEEALDDRVKKKADRYCK